MDLQEVATVSGKPGLHRVLKPTRNGVILESLDGTARKWVAGSGQRVSLLKEISIYVTEGEGTVPLEEVLWDLREKYGETLPIETKASNEEFFAFLGEHVKNFDAEKVYPSDIRKLVGWYELLTQHLPEVLERPKADEKKKATAEGGEAKAPKAAAKTGAAKKTQPRASTAAKGGGKTSMPRKTGGA